MKECKQRTLACLHPYEQSDCLRVMVPNQQSRACHNNQWPWTHPAHHSHGVHLLHTPQIHLLKGASNLQPKNQEPSGPESPKTKSLQNLQVLSQSLCTTSSIPFKKPHTFPKQLTPIPPTNIPSPAASIRAISCGSVTRWAWLKTMFGSCCGAWPLWSSTVQAPTRATRESPMLHSTACCPSGDNNATEAVVPRPEMNKSAHQMPQKKICTFQKSFQNRLLEVNFFSPSCHKDPHCSSSAETSHRTGPNFPERAATLPPQWSTTLRGTSPAKGDHTQSIRSRKKKQQIPQLGEKNVLPQKANLNLFLGGLIPWRCSCSLPMFLLIFSKSQ